MSYESCTPMSIRSCGRPPNCPCGPSWRTSGPSGTASVSDIEVRRVDFGYFVRPGEETQSGSARVEPCLGYLVEHPAGTLLLDTGMGSHPEIDAHYLPTRRDLKSALADVGAHLEAVTHVTNCHLHFDHCGGNPSLADRPIFVQTT